MSCLCLLLLSAFLLENEEKPQLVVVEKPDFPPPELVVDGAEVLTLASEPSWNQQEEEVSRPDFCTHGPWLA